MKAILFLSLSLVVNFAVAGDYSSACNELSILHAHHIENRDAIDNETFQNVEDAFNLLCRRSHENGAKVYYPNGNLATDNYNSDDATVYYPNSSVMIEQDDDGNTVFYAPTGEMITDDSHGVLSDLIYGVERKVAKIEAPFKAQHAKCAPGCTFVSWGIWGDAAHKKRKSCHNSGEAIDIHAIKCGKVTSKALTKKFDAYVSCMKKKFKVLYRQKDHFGHAHIQIPNCKMIKLK